MWFAFCVHLNSQMSRDATTVSQSRLIHAKHDYLCVMCVTMIRCISYLKDNKDYRQLKRVFTALHLMFDLKLLSYN